MLRLGRVALFVFAALIAGEGAAWAYCRTSACSSSPDGTGKVCEPPEPDDCGIPLSWSPSCVGFTVQQDGSRQVPLETIHGIAGESFTAWTNVACGSGAPSMRIKDLGDVACGRVEYSRSPSSKPDPITNPYVGDTNLIVFRDDNWPHPDHAGGDPKQSTIIALTTVTFNPETGEIVDADIEVNSEGFTFSTTDDVPVGMTDLRSVLTHEAGHFFGFAHSPDAFATMYASYAPQESIKRDLDDDDMTAM